MLHRNGELGNKYFSELTGKYSIDFATLMFARVMFEAPENHEAHLRYLAHLGDLNNSSVDSTFLIKARNFDFVFIHGLFNGITLPPHILTIHFVGAPLSGHVTRKIEKNYFSLSESVGPNDGLTSLYDELIPGGIVITEPGLDHYYRDENIDIKAIALVYTAIELINTQYSAKTD